MSRETDSSSSGTQGRGGAAYPSGTPPYGSRQYPSPHPSQDAQDGAPESADRKRPEEPRTETTLTTRIRINIPGSRPIPPVVMRTPVNEGDAADMERTSSIPRPGSPAADVPDAVPDAEAASAVTPLEPASDKPAGREKSSSDWFAPRKPPVNTSVTGPKTPVAGGTPGAPAGGGAATGAPTSGADAREGAAATPPRVEPPYFSDGPQHTPAPEAPRSGGSALDEFGVRAPEGPAAGPVGLTAGPAGGASPLSPNTATSTGSGGGAVPRLSDDTAELTPQFAAAVRAGSDGNVSGDTLTSGIPVITPEARPASSFPSAGGPGGLSARRADAAPRVEDGAMGTGPLGSGGSAAPTPVPPAGSAPASAPAKKKGRSKLVLLGAGVVGLAAVAYGAGLLMNHSDVPKGTTVLGVDIGGGTKEEAVAKLDAALGKRAVAPLQLSVDGKKTELVPDKAGLALDSQETVRAAAGSDYNPMSVIGSLFGQKRVVDPVIPVDEEKLGVALTDLAGVSGSASDGTIKFEPNKAIAVPGKAGKGLDVNQSMISVRDAYRAQVQTGKASTVQLPVISREPTITQAELDRAMKEFAQPAMSGLITIKAGPKQIQFGPARSLPQILSMVPVDGKLVQHYDKKAIDTLCDGVFDGIMITKGDGKKHQLNADDVAAAMQSALLGKTPAERTATIGLDGNG
ncbi:hypothetical protein ACF1FX_00360 [Streptomyces sp. NPDC014646]|uniref:hypothetical protein n=1 Tax=Streptomyces sp. NPDC014646 TaxID=3364877 RepID=UPI0036FAF213